MTVDSEHQKEGERSTERAAYRIYPPVNIPKEPSILTASRSSLSGLLSYLTFTAHGTRTGLEICACFLFFYLAQELLSTTVLFGEWRSLVAWFAACIGVAILDHCLFFPPLLALRRALGYDAAGDAVNALTSLERISPERNRFIRYDAPLYHLQRALVMIHAEIFDLGLYEIELAHGAGLSGEQYHLARIELSKGKRSGEEIQKELDSARAACGDLTSFKFEEGLYLFDNLQDYRSAIKRFDEMLARRDEILPIGVSSRAAARAFKEASRLWTGHAEEAIDGLSSAIRSILTGSRATEALRPLLARLYAERAYYFASHKEPELARVDLKIGSSLCSHALLQKALLRVKEELSFRYGSV